MRDHGLIVYTDPGADRPLAELGTIQCVHCGGHFEAPRFGCSEADQKSRVGRGFCMNCNGYICGPSCLECVPVEQYLYNLEHGLPDNHKPIIVGVPAWIGE